MEPRWLPAGYTVTSQLQVIQTSAVGGAAPGQQVVFFESSVAGYQALAQSVTPGTDAVVLDAGGDGLREMAAFLAGRHDLASVSIVAHGAPGMVSLGTEMLDSQALVTDAGPLGEVKSSLGPGADLLLWSCDVAAGAFGQAFLQELSSASGAAVAAATHPVGSSALGGSWQLDARTASLSVAAPFATDAFAGLLKGPTTTSLTESTGATTAFGVGITFTATLASSGTLATGTVVQRIWASSCWPQPSRALNRVSDVRPTGTVRTSASTAPPRPARC